MNSPRRAILILPVLAALFAGIAPQTAQQKNEEAEARDDKLRVEIVMLPVTVTDKKGGLVTDLTRDYFTVLDEGVPQTIDFFMNLDKPTSIGVLIDVSGSVVEQTSRKLVAVRESLSRFVEKSNKSNEYFIIAINRKAQLITDWTSGSDDIAKGLNQLAQMKHENGTALYDGCLLGIEKFKKTQNEKRVILLITDGQDSTSRAKHDEMREALKQTPVQIYSINLSYRTDPLAGYGQEVLKELSGISGGVAYFPSTAATIKEIFDYIALEVRHKYLIGYYATNTRRDGKWHPIKVKVTRPKDSPRDVSSLSARSQSGYYAPDDTRRVK